MPNRTDVRGRKGKLLRDAWQNFERQAIPAETNARTRRSLRRLASSRPAAPARANLAAVMAEGMADAGLPFVVIDPVGSWYGLRAGADGTKNGGLPLPIFGGKHGDVPLERHGGELLADLVVTKRLSCVAAHHGTAGPRRDRSMGCATRRSCSAPGRTSSVAGPGEGWVWSPHFLNRMSRHQFRRRRTFDSGATPKNLRGKDARPAATLADVDLGAIQTEMAATVERAKAEDPKELRRLLGEKDRRIKELERATSGFQSSNERAKQEVPVLTDTDRKRLSDLTSFLMALRKDVAEIEDHAIDRLKDKIGSLVNAAHAAEQLALRSKVDFAIERLERAGFQRILDKIGQVQTAPAPRHNPTTTKGPAAGFTGVAREPRRPPAAGPAGSSLTRGERVVLTAIAQHDGGVTREQLTVLTGYKRSSRDTYLQKLQARRLVEVNGSGIEATAAGIDALGNDFERLPTGDALRAYWLERLPAGERAVLEVLVSAYPRPIDREVISERTGYKRSSRDTYLQKLIARRLVDSVGRGEVSASEELFG